MRNSVKVVIDAYNGTTTFYVFDTEDPILAAYRRIFPALFKDASAMPADLRQHVRYPEVLFKLQSEVYGLYHMTDPRSSSTARTCGPSPRRPAATRMAQQAVQPMQPNFVLMKLPGGIAARSSSRSFPSRRPTGTT